MSHEIDDFTVDLNIRAFCKKELIEAFKFKLDLLKHEMSMIEIGIESNAKHTQIVAVLELQRDAKFLSTLADTLAFKLGARKSYSKLQDAVSTLIGIEQEHDTEKLPHETLTAEPQ